ncbi:hypothetical protein [Phenylobacterium sp.]|uniref:hypothetical protein n=1 Tax=Phenylobacterium sp. TaxID=1871053 RepID=UPI0025CFAA00|nr:hypothetical protein [Phenylobacterium sp.]MCA6355224.1 hypothetical protein [Phenylobacterium sp.]
MTNKKPSVEKIYFSAEEESPKQILIRLRARIADGLLLSLVQSSQGRFAVFYAKAFLVVAIVQSLILGTLPRWYIVAALTGVALVFGLVGRWIAVGLVTLYYPKLCDDDFAVEYLSGWDALRALSIMILPCALVMGCLGFVLTVLR